ncbi:MAG: 4-(cytidine 5'-diphospho)-2-C-methyl-D-erythritol kinase [Roseovarius sp.]
MEDAAPDSVIEAFAPAKINLTLHVTGQRSDGYHLLDSLVMFADIGDRVLVRPADTTSLKVTGPTATGVPTDGRNFALMAADLMGVNAAITVEKNLPLAAGIGGGSSDAATTLRALSKLSGRAVPADLICLGADTPVCAHGLGAARMRGVGEDVISAPGLPVLHAVLVNPNIPVLTSKVFAHLKHRENPPMPEALPQDVSASELIKWLKGMRNDLQPAAMESEPVVAQVFSALEVTPGCRLTRMSGSGGTCFGLYDDAETAAAAAGRLQETHAGWWTVVTQLNTGG